MHNKLNTPQQIDTFYEALAGYVRSLNGRFDVVGSSVLDAAWRKAYKQAGELEGVVSPEEGHRLAELHQITLQEEMRKVCGRFPADELFFAIRIMTPRVIHELGLTFYEDISPEKATIGTMGLRRAASYAALLYGGPVPKDHLTLVGGRVPNNQLKRFARTFVALMILSVTYLRTVWAFRATCSVGRRIRVAKDSMQLLDEDEEEMNILTYSMDERKNRYYDPLMCLGEFGWEIPQIWDPYEGPDLDKLGERAGLFTARYQMDSQRRSFYRLAAYLLNPLENFLWELNQLNPDLAKQAWGMSFEEFVTLLGGFCTMIKNRIADERFSELLEVSIVQSAHRSATVPFFNFELEQDGEGSLTEHAAAYAKSKDLVLEELDLHNAKQEFLKLIVSTGKHEVTDDSGDPLGMSIGDGRYSYLLHRFGQMYIADLFHADHWLNRPLDLLSGKMGGEAGRVRGEGVEERVWKYMKQSDAIEAVEGLRNRWVRRLDTGNQYNDLDCPLRLGSTLILAEVKGKYLGRSPEAFVKPELVERRWNENLKFLNKMDKTAKMLAARSNDITFRDSLKGIERILPVVVRSAPEWLPSLDEGYWIRKPTRTDVGVPRILTPRELRKFLESTTEEEIANLPGGYVVEVGTLS